MVSALVVLGLLAGAADGLRVELFLGAATSLPSTLAVDQEGAPTLELDANWANRSLDGPLYYAVRVAHGSPNREWSLFLVHHKLYLEDPPSEVASFAISHGYNLLTLERGWKTSGFWLRAGAGLVVAHPESTVRGLSWPQTGGLFGAGYFVTGPTLAVAASRRFALGARLELSGEGRFTASWAHVPVVAGNARVPNRSLHVLVGLGWRF